MLRPHLLRSVPLASTDSARPNPWPYSSVALWTQYRTELEQVPGSRGELLRIEADREIERARRCQGEPSATRRYGILPSVDERPQKTVDRPKSEIKRRARLGRARTR